MKKLLSLELAKVRNYRAFWAIILIYMVVVPLLFFGIGSISFPFFPSKAELFGFPTVWNYITWSASWINLLLGVLVVTLTCNEFTFRTHRQNIIDGLTRKQVILSKFYFYTFLAAMATLYTFLIGLVFGLIYSSIDNMFEEIYYVGIYFIQTLGYFSFAYLFAVLVRKSALAIVLYIVIFIVKFIFVLTLGDTIAQFMPINVIADLTPFPFFKALFEMAAAQDPNAYIPYILPQSIRTVTALGWISIFLILGYQLEKRRDL